MSAEGENRHLRQNDGEAFRQKDRAADRTLESRKAPKGQAHNARNLSGNYRQRNGRYVPVFLCRNCRSFCFWEVPVSGAFRVADHLIETEYHQL